MAKPQLIIGNKNLSSWSMRPWLALKVAGIELDERVVLFDTPEFKRVVKPVSPTGLVPVLVLDNGTAIWESLAICEWAAEQAPSLWPQDPTARAVARAVSNEMHAGFRYLRTVCPMNLKEKREGGTLSPEAGADVHRILELWRTCRTKYGSLGGGGPFLFGAFTIADAMFAPVTTRFTSYGIPADAAGRDYIDAIQSMPAFVEWQTAALAEPASDHDR